MYSTNIQLTTEEGMVCELYNEFHDITKLKDDIQKCVNEGDLSNVVSKDDKYKSTWVLENTNNELTKLSKVDAWGKTHYLTVLKESFDKINVPDLSNTPITPAGVGGGMPTRWIYSEYGRFLSVYGIRNGISLVFNLASANDIETKLQDLYKKRDNGLVDNLDLQELEERLRLMSNITIYGNGSEDQSAVALQESKGKSLSSKYDFAIITYDKSKMSRKNLKPWSILSLEDDGNRTNDGSPRVISVFGNNVQMVKNEQNGANGLYLVTKSNVSKIQKCRTDDEVLKTIDKLCDKVDVRKVDYAKIFDVRIDEEVNPATSPSKLAHMRRIQPLSHTDEANKKRRKTIEAKRETKLLGLNKEDLES